MTQPSDKAHVSPDMSVKTPDSMGIGSTQGQRAAEIISAIRAQQLPSPETNALTRFSGRLFARMVLQLAGNRAVGANIIGARTQAFSKIVKDHLKNRPNALVVELAAGFSPRGVQLAREIPTIKVIEIDLPDVLREKQFRLKRASDVIIPPNIEWRPGDLAKQLLAEVLNNERADVIVMEGLLPYFSREDCRLIISQALGSLKPDGISVCDILYRKEMEEINRLGVFSHYRRQAGSVKYHATSEEDIHELFSEAGFASATIYAPSRIAEEWQLIQPVKDYSFFVVGHPEKK